MMFISRDRMTVEKREKMREGNGTVTVVHCIEGKGAVQNNTNLLAELTLPPGASIGRHAHNGETECFVFLEGTGAANDNGTEISVKPGDTLVTGGGAFHSLTNTGSTPLKLLAVIIKD
jgi:mannose-6-phosphate isomerase-like protein (cupin superfamily)